MNGINATLILTHAFIQKVKTAPNNIAVINKNDKITYKELDRQSTVLANYLMQEQHVKRGEHVVISYERSIHFVVCMLAVLKCGAIYVPLDVNEPLIRKQYIIEDAKPSVLIVQENFCHDLAAYNCISFENLYLDNYQCEHTIRHITHCEDTACILYTSGSTGKPKGVMLPHKAIASLLNNPYCLEFSSGDRIISASSIAFDAGSFEIWSALVNGATLVCVPYEVLLNPEVLAEFLEQHKITYMLATAALFDQFAKLKPAMFKHLKYLMVAGDVVNPKSAERVINCKDGAPEYFINGYGPTECGILSTAYVVKHIDKKQKRLPIGKALTDTQLYVLDENLKPVQGREAGELYIGGNRLAKGYLNLPEKTKASFVQNPFSSNPKELIYKTGDRVQFLESGDLDFLGRIDRQIKFRGYRLELDGIESNLLSHPDVINSAVKIFERNGEKVLIGFIQLEAKSHLSIKAYKTYLEKMMPSYMCPAHIVIMDAMPVTHRGKIDREKLVMPVVDKNVSQKQKADSIEGELKNIWKELLGVNDYSKSDSFFELGGSSIMLAALCGEIKQRLDITLTVSQFLLQPTQEGLINLVAGETTVKNNEKCYLEDLNLLNDVELNLPPQKPFAKDVLLTGVTGFLGMHLLVQLLEESDKTLYCLIRGENLAEALQKLRSAAIKYKQTSVLKDMHRVVVVLGDLSQEKLGIASKVYSDIASCVEHIYHCGANVHHIYNYQQLRAENVLSTVELIKFAHHLSAKKLHFISTVSSIVETNKGGYAIEAISSKQPSNSFGGYALTKWVSEQLMQKAFVQGMSGTVLRPGNIYIHSKTRATSDANSNFSLMFLQACLAHNLAPQIDFAFEATPVDILAKEIVTLTEMKQANQKAFNLVNPFSLNLNEYIKLVNKVFYQAIKIVSYDKWKQEVIMKLQKEDRLYALSLYFQEEAEQELTQFETIQTQTLLQDSGIQTPVSYDAILRQVRRALRKTQETVAA